MTTVIPPKAKKKTIRETWAALATPKSIKDFTHLCVQAGVWTQDELLDAGFKHAMDEVRVALRALDDQGLPFAGPTSTKAATGNGQIWKQRTLWEAMDYELNVTDRLTQLGGDYRIIEGLAAECFDRYQVTLSVPALH